MHTEQNSEGDARRFRYSSDLAVEIEQRWQDRWEREGTFYAANPRGPLTGPSGQPGRADAPTFFVMDMFPYPSGKGLHVGHPLGYIATDVMGRFRRMCGDNVLHALGYDAFGLPAEQYAVTTGQHPRVTTEANIATMRRQLRRLGLAHDPRRSFATTDSDYVRWTQWIFLQIFNSYYDPESVRPDGGLGSARPITELVEAFETGAQDPPNGIEWASATEAQRSEILDQFRLAYVSNAPVNWCPGLGTVLANEEVTAEGRSERGNFPVFQRNLRQWMMRITAYADRLCDDLDLIDWPEKVKSMQRHWIGASTGAQVSFTVDGARRLEVYTTRPDTLFGATFMVVSPEHPLLASELPATWPEGTIDVWTGGHSDPAAAVAAYRSAASAKTAEERLGDGREKTGVFTGLFATNPVDQRQIPVFTADYVLMDYGTGAIMAVPAGDERDWEFAQTYQLPHIYTVAPPEDFAPGPWTGDGVAINSANDTLNLNGMGVAEAKEATIAWLADRGLGSAQTTYRLRDWLFSRQRYWGEPFPVVYDENDRPIALPDSLLPVDLPEVPDFSPRTYDPQDADSSPEPPLGRNQEWVNVRLDLGQGEKVYRRDTNTMPNWAGSCWYYLRYLDPDNEDQMVAPDLAQYWMGPTANSVGGVDLYVGGVEHAVLHLLYARFWHKVLFDLGHVPSPEPFKRLFNQGYIQAYAYEDAREQYVPADDVVAHDDGTFTFDGEPVTRTYGKMGKSKKNMVTPDDMYAQYGADTFRLYEMSMGPLDVSRPWETKAVVGSQRFLQRLWRNVISEATGEVVVSEGEPDLETTKLLHRTIAEVRTEMEAMRFNTAIARLIVLNNHLTGQDSPARSVIEQLVLMTAPLAPHLAEELWNRLGHAQSLAHEPFPVADPPYLVADSVTCVIQVQGKLRDRLQVAPDVSDDELERLALSSAAVIRALDGRGVRKVVVRAPNLVNIVVV